MTSTDKAQDVLLAAKMSLTDLAREALEAGRFEEAARCAQLADRLTRTCEEFFPAATAAPTSGLTARPDARKVQIDEDSPSRPQVTRPRASSLRRRAPHTRRGPMQSAPSDGYPRFFRSGDRLIKIGWSKAQGGEYEHRSPRSAVAALVEAIKTKRSESGLFDMDRLLPLSDPDGGGELPSYQAYLVLAWLKSCSVVTQRGRDGYVLEKDLSQGNALDELWESLPQQKK